MAHDSSVTPYDTDWNVVGVARPRVHVRLVTSGHTTRGRLWEESDCAMVAHDKPTTVTLYGLQSIVRGDGKPYAVGDYMHHCSSR
jgi:hypothetical protein